MAPYLLSLPAAAIYLGLFVLPLAVLFVESLRPFEPGFVGGRPDAGLTLENYAGLLSGSFSAALTTTLRIGFLASVTGIILALPLAHVCARGSHARLITLLIGFFVLLMFLGVLIRAYALQLTLGAVGPLRPVLLSLGIAPTSKGYIEFIVGAGLLHYILPLCVLTLVGPLRSVHPSLHESAQSLGASSWMAHATVTLPLCAPGILTAFLFSFTFSLSAFVIPMILGSGRVNFVSSLVYTRFSEIANYPSGAAISVGLLVLALATVALLSALVRRWTSVRLHS
jgi:putative spermidine/putrescine transport system permease protein